MNGAVGFGVFSSSALTAFMATDTSSAPKTGARSAASAATAGISSARMRVSPTTAWTCSSVGVPSTKRFTRSAAVAAPFSV